jgi:Protein of unknown function (DUF1761)
MPAVNWLAVIAAAIAMFAIGAAWYAPPVFGRKWMAINGFATTDPPPNVSVLFGTTFVLALLMSANLAFFTAGLGFGPTVAAALAAGLGWAAFGLSIIAMFERRPLAYHLINGGYLTVGFAAMGVILGLWK